MATAATTGASPRTPRPINTSFGHASTHNTNATAGYTPFNSSAPASSPSRPGSSATTPKTHHQTATSPSLSSKPPTSAVLAAISASPQLAAAIVKEYLTAKGLTRSLEAFRLEHLQFQPQTVSSRQELAKQLGISKHVQQNKTSDQPLKSYLEVIVKNLLTKTLTKDSSAPSSSAMVNLLESLANPNPVSDRPKDSPSLVGFKTPLGEFDSANPRSLPVPAPSGAYVASPSQRMAGSASSHARTSISAREIKDAVSGISHSSGNVGKPRPSSATSSASALIQDADDGGSEGVLSRPTTGGTTFSGTSGRTGFSKEKDATPETNSTLSSFRQSLKSSLLTPPNVSAPGSKNQKHAGDIEITEDFDDDLDDEEYYPTPLNLGSNKTGAVTGSGGNLSGGFVSKGTLISTNKALALRKVTFPGTGSEDSRGRASFMEEWKGKGFVFNTVVELGYGLVQSKGGPCGLLAAVQAYIIKYLAFSEKYPGALKGDKLRPTPSQSISALIDALAEILWQAGGTRYRRAVVALYKPNLRVQANVNPSHEKYMPDGITENMELHEFTELKMLREFINFNIDSFLGNDPGRHGLIQLLYSAVLSRGVDVVRDEDFDYRECSLIGRHGYCAQEMVNLLTVGQAISNVHDGDIVLAANDDADTNDHTILKGLKRPCQFGFVSLFEHYGSIKVGEYLKNPQLPVFVVCSESHFTTLFSTDRDLLNKTGRKCAHGLLVKSFDLIYYDQLAGQDAEIRLTIHPSGSSLGLDYGGSGILGGAGGGVGGRLKPVVTASSMFLNNGSSTAAGNVSSGQTSKKEDDLIPPLELVLRTKWSGCEVNWNDTEPLL